MSQQSFLPIEPGACVELTRVVRFNYRRSSDHFSRDDGLARGDQFTVESVEQLAGGLVVWLDVPMPRGNVLVPIDPEECVVVEGGCANVNAENEARHDHELAVRD